MAWCCSWFALGALQSSWLCCNLLVAGERGRPIGSVGLSRRLEFEPFVDKLNRLGQSGGAEAKSALDEAGLTWDVTRDVEGRCLSLAERTHHLEALDRRVSRPQRLEASDRPDQLLQLAVVSFDDVVQVLDLSVLRLLRTPALLL